MRAANTPKFQHLHRIWTWYSTHNVKYDGLNSHPYIIPYQLHHPKISTLDNTKLLHDSVQVIYTTVYGVWGNGG